MIVKLLTEHHLEFLSLKGGCRGSSESTHVKMLHCWKSHALAHMRMATNLLDQSRRSVFHQTFPCNGSLHQILALPCGQGSSPMVHLHQVLSCQFFQKFLICHNK